MGITISFFKHNTERTSRGYGDHYVVMLHGLGENPTEFDNLCELFEPHKYTIILPNMPGNMVEGLNRTAESAAKSIIDQIKQLHYSNIKKISIIGNSLGGLVAKKVLEKIDNFNLDSQYHFEYENFVTLVTPHLGISGSYTPLNLIRLFISYFLWDTGSNLRNPSLLAETETLEFKRIVMKFNKRANYVSNGIDLNVPAWSSRFGLSEEQMSERVKCESYLDLCVSCYNRVCIDDKKRDDGSSRKDRISHMSVKFNNVTWDMYGIPMYSLLNYGDVVGKHYNNRAVTWNMEEIENSMKHIRNLFE